MCRNYASAGIRIFSGYQNNESWCQPLVPSRAYNRRLLYRLMAPQLLFVYPGNRRPRSQVSMSPLRSPNPFGRTHTMIQRFLHSSLRPRLSARSGRVAQAHGFLVLRSRPVRQVRVPIKDGIPTLDAALHACRTTCCRLARMFALLGKGRGVKKIEPCAVPCISPGPGRSRCGSAKTVSGCRRARPLRQDAG